MSYELTNATSLAAVQSALNLPKIKQGIFATVALSGTPEAAFSTYICDGTADDVEINAAITAANAAGGGIVRIFAGQYDIAAHINLSFTSNIVLEGVGYATHLVLHAATTDNLIAAQNPTRLVIRNMRCDGNRANNTDPGGSQDAYQNNIALWNVNNVEITDVWSHSAIYHGIFIRDSAGDSEGVSIHDNWLYDNGYRAAHVHGSDTIAMRYIKVTDNFCYQNGQLNTVGNAGLFCMFANAKYGLVANNLVWGEGGYGITVSGAAVFAGSNTPAEQFVVAGNVIYNCKGAGIQIGQAAKKVALKGNIISGTQALSSTFGCGILIASFNDASTISEVLIEGNQIYGSVDRGIRVNSVLTTIKGLIIRQNIIADNTKDGICVDANILTMDGVEIEGNEITRNGIFAIVVSSTTPGSTNARRGFNISNNKCFENALGFYLAGLTHFTVAHNHLWDNVDNAGTWGSSSTSQVGINCNGTCTKGTVTDNHVGSVNRTNTGANIQFDSTCTDIEVNYNECYGTGTGLSIQGTRIYTRGNYGSADLKHTATSVDCVSMDDHSTNATPYTDQGGTRTKRRRLLSTSTAPTSASTAGIIGDEIFDGSGNLYRCTASGAAGSATWVKLSAAAV